MTQATVRTATMTTPSAASRCRTNRRKVRLFHQPDLTELFADVVETVMAAS
jgi:hypothetical protein